jgi:cysteinyl-tRNA synthetase
MKLYNSKTRQLEIFTPLQAGRVSMYVCGPTVYGEAHLGNVRPLVVFDTLRRSFEQLGYVVDYVSNYTDVDDKIIDKAQSEGVDESVITERYIKAYETLRTSLNALDLAATPRVTDTLESIVAFIDALVQKGYAYVVDGDVFFRVNKAENYGEISKQRVDELLAGARVEASLHKENPLDFVLWKKTEEGLKWPSPWSNGRPGWHTECVVMIDEHFHGMIDIHGGGMDLKFPHHENEVAQARACLHHPLANVWMHNGMLNIDGEKMSKSLGNVWLAKDLIQALGGNVVRWLMLSAHYRAPLNVSQTILDAATTEVNKLENTLRSTEIKAQLKGFSLKLSNPELQLSAFMDALADDLNTPNAVKVIFDTQKALNQATRQAEFTMEVAQLYQSLRRMLDIFGLRIETTTLSPEQIALFEAWQAAKVAQDFVRADALRQTLMEQNLLI